MGTRFLVSTIIFITSPIVYTISRTKSTYNKGECIHEKLEKKTVSLCLVLALCLSLGTVALAAPVADATIDTARTGSLDIYKYDFTNAAKDGVWDSSYVSTGVYDQAVNDALGSAVRAGDTDNSSDLGNGDTSYGYAIRGGRIHLPAGSRHLPVHRIRS